MSLPPFFSEKKTVLGRGGFVQHGPQTPKAVGGNRNFFERGGVIYIVFRGAKTELEKTGVWRFLAKKKLGCKPRNWHCGAMGGDLCVAGVKEKM